MCFYIKKLFNVPLVRISFGLPTSNTFLLFIKIILSQYDAAILRSCTQQSIVSLCLLSIFMIWYWYPISKWFVCSSRSITGAFWLNALASKVICFSPPDNERKCLYFIRHPFSQDLELWCMAHIPFLPSHWQPFVHPYLLCTDHL